MPKLGLVVATIVLSAVFLLETSCSKPGSRSDSDRQFQVDSTKIAEFVTKTFRGPGPGNPNQIPPQENFVVAVGIKDGPCKVNAGDIVYVAYKMESSENYWDCILRVENGRITKILKINIENTKTPQNMIKYLLEPGCK